MVFEEVREFNKIMKAKTKYMEAQAWQCRFDCTRYKDKNRRKENTA